MLASRELDALEMMTVSLQQQLVSSKALAREMEAVRKAIGGLQDSSVDATLTESKLTDAGVRHVVGGRPSCGENLGVARWNSGGDGESYSA